MLDSFFEKLLNPLREFSDGEQSLEKVRSSLLTINQYFFNTYKDIGLLHLDDPDFDGAYFSEFHKLWHQHSQEIIAPQIDTQRCIEAADTLHEVKMRFGEKAFALQNAFEGVDKSALATVRFLTANQDFRGSRSTADFLREYDNDPSKFSLYTIKENPGQFLTSLQLNTLSQTDKREKYASRAAAFLLQRDIDAIGIAEYFENDARRIVQELVSEVGMGYGPKKASMFIRDMVVCGVWPDLVHIEEIPPPSDINTMKVALRSGVLKTELSPLISSFLDIFCYQYGTIDYWSSQAWVEVWRQWSNRHPETAPSAPLFLDFFIYNVVGRELCKEFLVEHMGVACGHTYFWHRAATDKCLTCFELYSNVPVEVVQTDSGLIAQCTRERSHRYPVSNRRAKRCSECARIPIGESVIVARYLPCQKPEGHIALEHLSIVKNGPFPDLKVCPFVSVCRPTSDKFRLLNPPKSISIYGRTGWEDARTDAERGGGGLMA